MADAQRRSIKTSIYITLAVVLVPVLATTIILHEFLRRSERGRNADAAALAEVVGGELLADASVSHEALVRSCNRLINNPTVLAVCLWDQSGRVVAGAAAAADLQCWLEQRRSADDKRFAAQLVKLPAGLAPGHTFARQVETELGIPLGPDQPVRLAMLLDAAQPSVLDSPQAALLYVPLLVVTVSGWVVGSWWLRREIVRPIFSLLHAAAAGGPHGRQEEILERQDELGAIARTLVGLQENLSEWRERAELIERRVDSQIAAETQRITRELRRALKKAYLDPLTGISNRRLLEEKFPSIFAAQRDAGHDLSVVMIDVDHFKAVNDALGHAIGDALLKFVGELLRQCLRLDDLAVRYGGDEFLLVLPGTSAENAANLTSRIIAMFAQRAKIIANTRPSPTLSAGIASIRQNRPAHPRDLVCAADHALYQAKQHGSRRVCVAAAV
jgi:diguanylate cyclase